jgi:phosphomethylpyrimidine synthase
MAGADFLCYVTPAEHLSLPNLQDVKDGIIAFKIAAHAVDLTRGKDWDRDKKMSIARRDLDWETQKNTALDPDSFDKYRKALPADLDACTMCGEFCALK